MAADAGIGTTPQRLNFPRTLWASMHRQYHNQARPYHKPGCRLSTASCISHGPARGTSTTPQQCTSDKACQQPTNPAGVGPPSSVLHPFHQATPQGLLRNRDPTAEAPEDEGKQLNYTGCGESLPNTTSQLLAPHVPATCQHEPLLLSEYALRMQTKTISTKPLWAAPSQEYLQEAETLPSVPKEKVSAGTIDLQTLKESQTTAQIPRVSSEHQQQQPVEGVLPTSTPRARTRAPWQPYLAGFLDGRAHVAIFTLSRGSQQPTQKLSIRPRLRVQVPQELECVLGTMQEHLGRGMLEKRDNGYVALVFTNSRVAKRRVVPYILRNWAHFHVKRMPLLAYCVAVRLYVQKVHLEEAGAKVFDFLHVATRASLQQQALGSPYARALLAVHLLTASTQQHVAKTLAALLCEIVAWYEDPDRSVSEEAAQYLLPQVQAASALSVSPEVSRFQAYGVLDACASINLLVQHAARKHATSTARLRFVLNLPASSTGVQLARKLVTEMWTAAGYPPVALPATAHKVHVQALADLKNVVLPYWASCEDASGVPHPWLPRIDAAQRVVDLLEAKATVTEEGLISVLQAFAGLNEREYSKMRQYASLYAPDYLDTLRLSTADTWGLPIAHVWEEVQRGRQYGISCHVNYLAGVIDHSAKVQIYVTKDATGAAQMCATFYLRPNGRRQAHLLRHVAYVFRDHVQVGRVEVESGGVSFRAGGGNARDENVIAAFIWQNVHVWVLSRVPMLAFCAVVLLSRGLVRWEAEHMELLTCLVELASGRGETLKDQYCHVAEKLLHVCTLAQSGSGVEEVLTAAKDLLIDGQANVVRQLLGSSRGTDQPNPSEQVSRSTVPEQVSSTTNPGHAPTLRARIPEAYIRGLCDAYGLPSLQCSRVPRGFRVRVRLELSLPDIPPTQELLRHLDGLVTHANTAPNSGSTLRWMTGDRGLVPLLRFLDGAAGSSIKGSIPGDSEPCDSLLVDSIQGGSEPCDSLLVDSIQGGSVPNGSASTDSVPASSGYGARGGYPFVLQNHVRLFSSILRGRKGRSLDAHEFASVLQQYATLGPWEASSAEAMANKLLGCSLTAGDKWGALAGATSNGLESRRAKSSAVVCNGLDSKVLRQSPVQCNVAQSTARESRGGQSNRVDFRSLQTAPVQTTNVQASKHVAGGHIQQLLRGFPPPVRPLPADMARDDVALDAYWAAVLDARCAVVLDVSTGKDTSRQSVYMRPMFRVVTGNKFPAAAFQLLRHHLGFGEAAESSTHSGQMQLRVTSVRKIYTYLAPYLLSRWRHFRLSRVPCLALCLVALLHHRGFSAMRGWMRVYTWLARAPKEREDEGYRRSLVAILLHVLDNVPLSLSQHVLLELTSDEREGKGQKNRGAVSRTEFEETGQETGGNEGTQWTNSAGQCVVHSACSSFDGTQAADVAAELLRVNGQQQTVATMAKSNPAAPGTFCNVSNNQGWRSTPQVRKAASRYLRRAQQLDLLEGPAPTASYDEVLGYIDALGQFGVKARQYVNGQHFYAYFDLDKVPATPATSAVVAGIRRLLKPYKFAKVGSRLTQDEALKQLLTHVVDNRGGLPFLQANHVLGYAHVCRLLWGAGEKGPRGGAKLYRDAAPKGNLVPLGLGSTATMHDSTQSPGATNSQNNLPGELAHEKTSLGMQEPDTNSEAYRNDRNQSSVPQHQQYTATSNDDQHAHVARAVEQLREVKSRLRFHPVNAHVRGTLTQVEAARPHSLLQQLQARFPATHPRISRDTVQYWVASMDVLGACYLELAGKDSVLMYPEWKVACGRPWLGQVPFHLEQLLGCGSLVEQGQSRSFVISDVEALRTCFLPFALENWALWRLCKVQLLSLCVDVMLLNRQLLGGKTQSGLRDLAGFLKQARKRGGEAGYRRVLLAVTLVLLDDLPDDVTCEVLQELAAGFQGEGCGEELNRVSTEQPYQGNGKVAENVELQPDLDTARGSNEKSTLLPLVKRAARVKTVEENDEHAFAVAAAAADVASDDHYTRYVPSAITKQDILDAQLYPSNVASHVSKYLLAASQCGLLETAGTGLNTAQLHGYVDAKGRFFVTDHGDDHSVARSVRWKFVFNCGKHDAVGSAQDTEVDALLSDMRHAIGLLPARNPKGRCSEEVSSKLSAQIHHAACHQSDSQGIRCPGHRGHSVDAMKPVEQQHVPVQGEGVPQERTQSSGLHDGSSRAVLSSERMGQRQVYHEAQPDAGFRYYGDTANDSLAMQPSSTRRRVSFQFSVTSNDSLRKVVQFVCQVRGRYPFLNRELLARVGRVLEVGST